MALARFPDAAVDAEDRALASRMDDVRLAAEAEMEFVRRRAQVYLNWYSPPYNERLGTHDAWLTNLGVNEPITADNIGLTRANYPIARAVVDIWTSLEAAQWPTPRAEPERVQPPPPVMDQDTAMRLNLEYSTWKRLESMKADLRGHVLRRDLRLDNFPLKNYLATRRKNLYGFSWVKVVPDMRNKRPQSHVLRNPTVVYPMYSENAPEELEMLLVAYQMDARKANAKFHLGLNIDANGMVMGQDSARYRQLNDRYFDTTRRFVWVEELWWTSRNFNSHHEQSNVTVSCGKRVAGQIVPSTKHTYEWERIPYVQYQNTDERDNYGWSDIAGVIDINDEFNRRMSQQGDIIGNYAAPRFQLLNAIAGKDLDLPGPFEMISLNDQERIEQILTRIDTFPAQTHFSILTDLLHRVTGLPPIVWGLIANAQTSGRALTASWKATEARLSPKLMANEAALRRWESIILDYRRHYNWQNLGRAFVDNNGDPFTDFRWEFPPMEPRDFQEVTMNEITKRDAGLTTTVKAMRATGDEAAEDTREEVMAEFGNVLLHPDKRQAFLLAQRAELENAMMAAQVQAQGQQTAQNLPEAAAQQQQAVAGPQAAPTAVPAQPGAEGTPLPPAREGQAQPVEPAPQSNLSSGELMRGGEVSSQFLRTSKY